MDNRNRFQGGRGDFNRSRDREMYSTDANGNELVCADCKATGFKLPFKADGNRPVYCPECNRNHRPQRDRDSRPQRRY